MLVPSGKCLIREERNTLVEDMKCHILVMTAGESNLYKGEGERKGRREDEQERIGGSDGKKRRGGEGGGLGGGGKNE